VNLVAPEVALRMLLAETYWDHILYLVVIRDITIPIKVYDLEKQAKMGQLN
jgi:hypothetical protein